MSDTHDEASDSTTVQPISTEPAGDDSPRMPPPSPTVEPFVSGGGPPPAAPKPPRRKGRGLLFFLILLLLAAIGAGVYTLLGNSLFPKASVSPSVSSATPTPTPATSNYAAPLGDLNNSLTALDTDLAGVNTALNDNQGNLSE